jgi:hypothetical protein
MIKGSFIQNQRGTELENLEKKKEIIAKIEVLATEKSMHIPMAGSNRSLAQLCCWKVPSDVNEETWTSFKS